MLRLLITKFWPALIPILIYALWYGFKRYRLRKTGEEIRITDGPWLLTLFCAAIVLAVCLFSYRLSDDLQGPSQYTPAQTIDGKIVDGSLKPNSSTREGSAP